jgi:hypothetical protein
MQNVSPLTAQGLKPVSEVDSSGMAKSRALIRTLPAARMRPCALIQSFVF